MTTKKQVLSNQSRIENLFHHQINMPGFARFISEYRFHPNRLWRFDFVFPDYNLAVELEGGTYSHGRRTKTGHTLKSRHLTPTGFYQDCEKYAEAAIQGWSVLRFDSRMVREGSAFDYTVRAIEAKGFRWKKA
ncbi:endonuclease domain-containing protein [Spartinivicinus ruber]|uniref:endonuclease domain-containing protein n=1 Tax=Spartinivicinus ruber TaxID=2683272 RepID=UPI001E2915E5|nr:endonuclease domain-containing protein [Spartinivicinus ruber]